MSDVVSAIARVSQIVQGLQAVEAVATGSDFASVLGGATSGLGPAEADPAVTPASASVPSAGPTLLTTAPDGAGLAQRVIEQAESMIGRPYVWGAEGPSGFDCSGLVYWAFRAAGSQVPRLSAHGYMDASTPVSRADLQPGDLVFFNYGRLPSGTADHIGIYVGDGRIVEASSSAGSVVIRPVDWDNFIGGGRLS